MIRVRTPFSLNVVCQEDDDLQTMADIIPPFTAETARKKVKAAQAAWNSK